MMVRYVLVAIGLLTFRAQTQMSDEVKELIALGRDSVINLAVHSLENGFGEFEGWGSHFQAVNPEIFDRLAVMTDGSDVKVLFERSIKFYPLDTALVMGAVVKLINQSMGFSDAVTTEDGLEIDRFYEYTMADQKAIEFIISHNGPISQEQTMEVLEQDDCYIVTIVGKETEGGYRLEKITGKEYENWHTSKSEAFDDGYRTIDWGN